MPATPARPEPKAPKPPKPHRVRLTLVIDGMPYGVRPLRPEELPAGAVRGFRLKRADRKLVWVRHAIATGPDGPICTCGDSTFRQLPTGGECKHVRAATAVGLL